MATKKSEEQALEQATEAEHASDEEVALTLDEAIENLSGPNRRKRQEAAHFIAAQAHQDAQPLADCVDQLVDALFRPEAQTRWEVLDALAQLGKSKLADVSSAVEGAEAALFDENAAIVRLAAFRLVSVLAAQSPAASDELWPLLDEAIQCYHGDPEYRDMLAALLDFAQGDISKQTREALITRISFDAENGGGYIKTCSRDVLVAAGVNVS